MGRRRKTRSLSSQITHMVKEATRFGVSKHGVKKQGDSTVDKFFSGQTRKDALSFFKRMAKEIKAAHPEVRKVKDLKAEYVQEFLDKNAPQWQANTAAQYLSFIHKMAAVANSQYESCHLDYSGVKITGSRPVSEVGKAAMTLEEAKMVIANMNPNSLARDVPEITLRTGARISEAVSIEPDHVVLDDKDHTGCITFIHTKGGRHRTVQLRTESDYQFFKKLKETAQRNQWKTLVPVGPRAAATAVRQSMQRTGLSQKYPHMANHRIRGTYATQRYYEERNSGLSHKEAWGRVCKDLGHGENREVLFQTYVGRGMK